MRRTLLLSTALGAVALLAAPALADCGSATQLTMTSAVAPQPAQQGGFIILAQGAGGGGSGGLSGGTPGSPGAGTGGTSSPNAAVTTPPASGSNPPVGAATTLAPSSGGMTGAPAPGSTSITPTPGMSGAQPGAQSGSGPSSSGTQNR